MKTERMNNTNTRYIHYTLRIAVAMCFIGHGAFGIITKPIWCNYFAVFGIGKEFAYKIMPVVGSIDILLGIIMIFYPVRAILIYLIFWGLATASLRPLSGEHFAELIERAGNFGVPLALLIFVGGIRGMRQNIFSRLDTMKEIDTKSFSRALLCLRIVVFLLIAGHGWLNLIEKKGIISQYQSLGLSSPANIALTVGIFEIATAFLVLFRPIRPVIFMLLIWKMASELFYPHYEFFEWVERGGSFGAILALWLGLGAGSIGMRVRKKVDWLIG